MGTITSGVGLISGINSKNIIDQLISIDARPRDLVQKNVTLLQTQQTAFQDISAKLLVLKLNASGFNTNKTFQTTKATSSDSNVLTATASSSAVPGSYSFSVDRLVSTQQLITRGYSDSSSTPVGAGTLTFEFGDAKLDADTSLNRLNGGNGITRGKVRITDRSGSSAVVDLSKALTVGDVIKTINNTSGINVAASVSGDQFVLTDNTGATTTSLVVSDVQGSGTTASLGLNTAAVGNTLTATSVNTVSRSTLLTNLNDGNGVYNITGSADLRVTRRDGSTFDVNLDGASTLGSVIDKINTASGGNVTASVNSSKTGLQIVDSTSGGTALSVANIGDSTAATDLGLLGSANGGSDTITGKRVIAGLNSKLISNLKGGAGATLGTIRVTNRAGTATDIDLSGASSVSDLLSTINNSGANVTASLNSVGTGIKLTDNTGSTTSNLIVTDVSGTAATNLGLAQSVASTSIDSGNLQFRYITTGTLLSSLNGGTGISRGKFKLTDSSGAVGEVDLTQGDEVTIGDVLREINSRGLAITASVNANGDGILLTDTGPGTQAIKVEESGGTTAKDLGILGSAATAGAALNGSFEKTITLSATDTLDDLSTKINDAGIGVKAAIINDGSGANQFRLSLTSTKSGRAGSYVLNDGGLGLEASTLTAAQDAVVFFGSSDPAKAVAIRSATNSLNTLIPGATVNLLSTSSNPITLTVSRDDAALAKSVRDFVSSFNTAVDSLDKYDTYNADTKQKGLLLGDTTVSVIRSGLFRLANNPNTDVKGRYNTLAQVGVTVGSGAKLVFDETKFNNALSTDRAAVESLFTLKTTTTTTDSTSGVNTTSIATGGVAVRIDQFLDGLTNSTSGIITNRSKSITSQVELGNKRIDQLNGLLDAKRARLTSQYAKMESTLAQLQNQGSSLNSLSSIASTK